MEINSINKRYQDAAWLKKNRYPLVIGAGSTGSMVAYYLSKQVNMLTVYDGDVIETHNQGVQLYGTSFIGQKKVHALSEMLKELSRVNDHNYTSLITQDKHWDKDYNSVSTHTFSCVDNIEVRKELFNKWANNYGDDANGIFIDIRMSAEFAQVFVVKGCDDTAIEAYRQSLDGEFPNGTCTYQMTVQCASLAAGMAVQAYNNACIGLPVIFESYFNGPTLQWTYHPAQIINDDDESITSTDDLADVTEQVSAVPTLDEDRSEGVAASEGAGES